MRESEINKISESMRGKFGKDSRRWKGDDASYVAKHMWIIKHYGNASKCSFNPSHVARRYEWANISGEYKRDISDYLELCPSCHRKYDYDKKALKRGNGKKKICKHGHELTEHTIYVDSRGYRNCKECRKESQKKRVKKHA
jgi:hypothetical protein